MPWYFAVAYHLDIVLEAEVLIVTLQFFGCVPLAELCQFELIFTYILFDVFLEMFRLLDTLFELLRVLHHLLFHRQLQVLLLHIIVLHFAQIHLNHLFERHLRLWQWFLLVYLLVYVGNDFYNRAGEV